MFPPDLVVHLWQTGFWTLNVIVIIMSVFRNRREVVLYDALRQLRGSTPHTVQTLKVFAIVANGYTGKVKAQAIAYLVDLAASCADESAFKILQEDIPEADLRRFLSGLNNQRLKMLTQEGGEHFCDTGKKLVCLAFGLRTSIHLEDPLNQKEYGFLNDRLGTNIRMP